jgi:pSer/pThr/pTyr-binding forkhead associated (FHA) protein/ribosomal protein L40E
MIVCPHCNHQNPEEAIQCEACYTPLPTTTNCPNCGTQVQTDATFCGQCGFNLRPDINSEDDAPETLVTSSKGKAKTYKIDANQDEDDAIDPTVQTISSTSHSSPLVEVSNLKAEENTPAASKETSYSWNSDESADLNIHSPTNEQEDLWSFLPQEPESTPAPVESQSELDSGPLRLPDMPSEPIAPPKKNPPAKPASSPSSFSPSSLPGSSPTRIQLQTASLFHVQTQTQIELPFALSVIHMGKPNEQIPPDIDVSGYPDSEIVSRVHADMRVEGDIYYIEDVGSSNGTYINHTPLSPGNRHRLRSGDRISLGKGDKMTFIFQLK